MKKFVKQVWEFLKANCIKINLILFSVALFAQFNSALPLISGFMDHRSIVEAHDNDAGKMVEVGERSRWYNDNQFRYYGPLYFRITNTFHSIAPATSGHYPIDSIESQEESVHFYLLLVSLLGLFLLAVSTSYLISDKWEVRLLLTLFLAAAFLRHPVWSQYLLTAHPDHLLTGLAGLSIVLTLLAINDGFSDKGIKRAGLAWGLTVATKLSSVFFIPGLLILFFFLRPNTETFKSSTKKIILVALGAYFAVGFPQNFDVGGSVRKMLRLSEFSSASTWKAFTEWWGYILSQSAWPLLILFVGALFFGKKIGRFTWKQNLIILIGLNLGIFILTLRTLELIHTYYAMPFIAALCVSLGFLFSQWSLRPLLFEKRHPIVLQSILFLVFVLASWFDIFQFKTLHQSQVQMLACRENFRVVYAKTNDILKQEKTIITTPYTPVPLRDEEAVKVDWELNFERVVERNPSLMVFSRAYYGRYTDDDTPSAYVQITNSEWAKTQEFYKTFLNQTEVSHARIGNWKRIYYDDCNLEMWEKM